MVRTHGLLLAALLGFPLLAGCSWNLPPIPCTSDDHCPSEQSCQGKTCGPRPACNNPQVACGSACVNLSQDANNCGSCGNSCGGRTCSGGACAPARFTITTTTGGTGTGVVTSTPGGINCPLQCSTDFPAGTVVALAQSPGNGSTFTGWGGACSGTGACSVTLNANTNVVANFAAAATTRILAVTISGTSPGAVVSTPPGINCATGTCSAAFPSGTVVSLAASPGGGSSFGGWTGACGGNGACTVTLNANSNVTATFNPLGSTQQTLALTIAGAGTGSVSASPGALSCSSGACNLQFNTGTSVTLTATPSGGSTFSGFSGDCTGSSCVVSMSAGRTVTATFAPASAGTRTLTVTVTGPGVVDSTPAGIIGCTATAGTCSAAFATGTSVSLAQSSTGSGSVFSGWSGACNGSGACSVTLSNNTAVSAAFTKGVLVTVVPAGDGTGSVVSSPVGIDCPATSCSGSFAQGQSVTLTSTAGGSSVFTGYSGGCTGTSCMLSFLSADVSVTATFAKLFTLSVAETGCGTIVSTPGNIGCYGATGVPSGTGVCSAQFASGTTVKLDAVNPCGGNLFLGFGGACTSGTGQCSLLMNQDRAATAAFGGFTIATRTDTFSLVQGESRSFDVTVARTDPSAPISAALTLDALPAGVTASFSPATVAAPGLSKLTITTAVNAVLGQGNQKVTATNGTLTPSSYFQLEIRSPLLLVQPSGVAPESNQTTALVTENNTRISRIDLATKKVVNTIAEVSGVRAVALESGGATALATAWDTLVRVNLASGAVTTLSSALATARGVVAVSGTTALVVDCGTNTTCYSGANGRLVSVALASGVVTPLATSLAGPTSLALEAGGLKALVTETAAGRLLEINLSSGGVLAIATGLDTPTGVVLEPGGTSALVAEAGGRFTRVTLATGTKSPFVILTGSGSGDIALRDDGHTLLTSFTPFLGAFGRLVGIDARWPMATIAPSRQSSTQLVDPRALALEASGTTALVADCNGPCNGTTSRLLRVTLANGAIAPIVTTGLQDPRAIALLDNNTALVTEGYGGRLTRVKLSDGTWTSPVTGLSDPWGVAVEAGGATALLAETAGHVVRVNLSTGTKTTLGNVPGNTCCNAYAHDIVIESGGTKALVASSSYGSGLFRMDLASGSTVDLAVGLSDPFGLSLESGGATAIVSENTSDRVSRVDLASGNSTVLGSTTGEFNGGQNPLGVAVEAGGASALTIVNNKLVRVTFGAAWSPQTIARGLEIGQQQAMVSPEGGAFAIEADGRILYADCSGTTPFCGRLFRTTLAGGAPTLLASGFNAIGGVAALDANTALITDCGPTKDVCTAGRIWRVPLDGSAATPLVTGLNTPLSIVIEPASGTPPTTALVAEYGTGRVLRVTIGDGSAVAVGTGLRFVNQVAVEAGGLTALVAANNELSRIDLATHVVTPLLVGMNLRTFAIEPGGSTALIAGIYSGLNAVLGRVDLTTGGVDILRGGLFDRVGMMTLNLVADPTGKTLVFSEPKTNLRGAIYKLAF